MPKLQPLSNTQLIKIINSLGFQMISQKGSHIKFLRVDKFQKHILIIPNHKQIAVGTLKEIFNQLCNFFSKEELYDLFYK